MKKPKDAGSDLTPAQREAAAAFKQALPALTGEQQAKRDLDENRERLKALRLAHEAEQGKKA